MEKHTVDIHTFFKPARILVVGDAMLDRYIFGASERHSPEAPVPVVDYEKDFEMPGGAANVALNFKNLGGEVALCGVIGSDEAGEKLVRHLQKDDIDSTYILKSEDRITTEKIRIFGNDRQLLRVDKEDKFPLTSSEEPRLMRLLDDAFHSFNPNVLVFQDYNKGVLTRSVIAYLVKKCRELGVFTAADPKFDNFFEYRGVDLFKPNQLELSTAVGRPVRPDLRDLMTCAIAINKKLQAGCILVTLAHKGIFIANETYQIISPALDIEIKDVSGAGDTVLAVATMAHFSGLPLKQTAELCNAVAAEVCRQSGVVSADKSHIMSWLLNFKQV